MKLNEEPNTLNFHLGSSEKASLNDSSRNPIKSQKANKASRVKATVSGQSEKVANGEKSMYEHQLEIDNNQFVKTLSWNCQGLGHKNTRQQLENLVLSQNPDILFLSETKQLKPFVEKTLNKYLYYNCVCHDPVGSAGGLAVSWDISYKDSRKDNSWKLVNQMGENMNKPWLVLGDLNVILNKEEKRGSNPANSSDIRKFSAMFNNLGLKDIGFLGFPFTWSNHQEGDKHIEERLDRGMENGQCIIQFPNASLRHLNHSGSDHSAILMNTLFIVKMVSSLLNSLAFIRKSRIVGT
ncbi:uncharacterized protein LOC113312039 [Papaver somniferum]|uniref:uncharacterized protein LOC113312039 n=1 Tax=Papaver somniferum TaxID=3469 RepID=UPI000E6F80E8|nr:uncharacterized protein LOC113312039 [Papaver somniferum]